MISIIHFAIIFSIFSLSNCKDEENKKKYVMVPIRVRREPPDTVEFQFNKNVQIEPISLKANEVNFQISQENDDVKKFRNLTPLQQGDSQIIKIILEYREPERTERKVQSFQHAFRENLDEVITVQIEISLPKMRPQSEAPMEVAGEDAIGVPEAFHSPTKPTDKIHSMINRAWDDDFETSCENDETYADKLLDTALRHSKLGTHLLLTGLADTSVNPVDILRELIATNLELPQLEHKILQAKFINEGLLFEMQSPKDVVEILSKNDAVDFNGLNIEPTMKNIFYNTIDVRSGFDIEVS